MYHYGFIKHQCLIPLELLNGIAYVGMLKLKFSAYHFGSSLYSLFVLLLLFENRMRTIYLTVRSHA